MQTEAFNKYSVLYLQSRMTKLTLWGMHLKKIEKNGNITQQNIASVNLYRSKEYLYLRRDYSRILWP